MCANRRVALTVALALLVPCLALASGAFEPPDGWRSATTAEELRAGALPAAVYLSLPVAPGVLWRNGSERLRWTEFPDRHRADSASTLERALGGREFAIDGKSSLRRENRCSARAWWIHWASASPAGKVLEQRELVFENNGFIGLIQYMYPRGTAPDPGVLASMIRYCSTFTGTTKL
jgi:hypothetical protein